MNKIIDIALKQVGVKEYPPNSNNVLYNTWFYGKVVQDNPANGEYYPWCGTAVSWVYFTAGYPLGNIGYTKGFAGCATALRHFQQSGEVILKERVTPGDIFIVDWDGNGQPDHTGIVMDTRTLAAGGDFITLEGNTSAVGSQSNGGEYLQKLRHYVCGKAKWFFIHPKILDTK